MISLDANFWVLVSFIIFSYLVYRPCKKLILKFLDEKIEQIKSSLNEARDLKNQALHLLNDAKAEIKSLNALKAKALEDAETKVKEYIEKRKTEVDIEFEYKKDQMKSYIKEKQQDTLNFVKHELLNESIILAEKYFKVTDNENLSDFEIGSKINSENLSTYKN